VAGVEAERAHAAKVQDALYRIAELASAAQDMQEFYRAIHEIVGELMDARNIFIALYDEERRLINWPYFVDAEDSEAPDHIPDPRQWFEFGEGEARGVTAYVLRTNKPLRLPAERMMELVEQGEVELIGTVTEDWLGVPLHSAEGRSVGVLAVASYTEGFRYTDQDEDLLAFVGQHVGAALSRARAIEETRQRNAELALINSVQEALAGELEMQALYDVVGDKIQEIFDAQIVDISTYDRASGLVNFAYSIESGERVSWEPYPLESLGFMRRVIETGEPMMLNEDVSGTRERLGLPAPVTEPPKSALWAPLLAGREVTGLISLQNMDREHAFSESDQQLLTTLAGSLSVALENARLVHETRQRNAELALINSVQEALAGELKMQAIYDVVGDKIQEIFDAQGTCISIADDATGLVSFPYLIERGERLSAEPTLLTSGFTGRVLETREPLMINEDLAAEAERQGSFLVAGESPKSLLFVPLVTGGRALGVISLENYDREHAFDDADQRLLTTLAGSLTVALENARLVHETRQRNAELALINSVQEALAGELEMQAIYDVVGDKIQEIFDAQVVDIGIFDFAAGTTHFPYAIERGVRYPDEPTPIERSPITQEIFETNAAVLIGDVPGRMQERGEAFTVAQGEPALSVLAVPLGSGDAIRGRISLQNLDRTNAFSESDVRLLTTLAGSLSVALENARLVHETRQRNAELALINSVQDAIAGELDDQAIYDAVGDEIREIFDAQVVSIRTLDETTGLLHYPYVLERGERLEAEPQTLQGFSKHVLASREPLLIVEDMDAEAERYGSPTVPGTEDTKSLLFVPLVAGGKATGVIALENIDREHAFSESDQQLLETLAGSLSVALENARLVHETRQRNAELALINGVQDAIAGELDPQAIYDAVGDRIQEIFDAQAVSIFTLDETTGLMHIPYLIERGERMEAEPTVPVGFSKHVLETRESLLVAENVDAEAQRYGSEIAAGETPKSVLFVPLVTGRKATGVLSLQNVDREHAFDESDQQLLETLAGSLSVALENARLVHETRQRNAELALINSVQDAIAGELDPQAIYTAVGDRVREVFDAQVVSIRVFDEATGLLHFPYILERGERLQAEPSPPIGFAKHVLETRRPLLIAENMEVEAERYGSTVITGEMAKSALLVPLITGGRTAGVISLQNIDREHAFSEVDQQLLTTVAGSVSVALENARLVQETQQRNAELALINSVQDAIAGELEPQAIYDAVGDRIRDVFDAQVVTIAAVDEAAGSMHFPYIIERGERLEQDPISIAGFTKHVLDTREPLLITENVEVERERHGSAVIADGEEPKSVLFVPLVAGGKATGTISIQNVDREHAFDEADQQLLTTVAGSLSVALENARLVEETRQRVAELATVNSVGHALSSQLDLDALIELVGEHVRETFGADLAYVALHDEVSGRIEFAYYYESGERRQEAPMEYGEGLTSQILRSREPLLLNRREQLEGADESIGTPSLSYLGVPILVGAKAIGVISVQAIHEEGRFGEADSRLLATIAANVGVAIQNARLFSEIDRQKQYFEMLVDVSPAAIVVMDADERVTGWNPAAARLFGYTADEAIGRTIDELVVPDELRGESRDVTVEALGQGRTRRITRRAGKDGGLLDVEMELVPLRFEGENPGFYAIYHDITELQRAREEAEAATQAKSAFLATMSHEIRTPMNAVIGMTDLLLGTDLTGEQREFAEVVHSSGDALLHVIDDILDYSKIEAGKLDLENEPFNLRDCVEGALDIVAPRAWEKELELGCLIDDDAPAGIVGDEARLRQVLLNLLSNAVKFTERGEVVVLVDATDTGSGSYEVELAVRDTGIGIPPDRMDLLFASFSQVDASTTRRFGGTGLGLAISKRLVELMGGTISVESEQEKGSTFRISLPVTAAAVTGLRSTTGSRISPASAS
jgi:PAS domain S-box-containing protein